MASLCLPTAPLFFVVRHWQGASRKTPRSHTSTSETTSSAMQVLRPCRLLGGLALPPCRVPLFFLFVRLWQGASRKTPRSRTSRSTTTKSAMQVLRPCRLLGGLALPPYSSLVFCCQALAGCLKENSTVTYIDLDDNFGDAGREALSAAPELCLLSWAHCSAPLRLGGTFLRPSRTTAVWRRPARITRRVAQYFLQSVLLTHGS